MNKNLILHWPTSNRDKKIDVIINNAGINDINLIEDVTDEEIDKIITISGVLKCIYQEMGNYY